MHHDVTVGRDTISKFFRWGQKNQKVCQNFPSRTKLTIGARGGVNFPSQTKLSTTEGAIFRLNYRDNFKTTSGRETFIWRGGRRPQSLLFGEDFRNYGGDIFNS